ncbi:MAG: hypothetical protein ABW185_03670 [Sedimenticola sp.]
MTQFVRGMDEVGSFHQTITKHADLLEPLFVSQTEGALTFARLRELFKYDFSDEGSNYRRAENNAVYCLESFLADCEGMF